MTASQFRKSAHRARRFSPGHGRTRSDIRQWPQIVRQLEELDTTRRSFVSRFTLKQLVASARSKSARSPAALKSP
jgi:hypothetical protein